MLTEILSGGLLALGTTGPLIAYRYVRDTLCERKAR